VNDLVEGTFSFLKLLGKGFGVGGLGGLGFNHLTPIIL
jgi:hypothetical protein